MVLRTHVAFRKLQVPAPVPYKLYKTGHGKNPSIGKFKIIFGYTD